MGNEYGDWYYVKKPYLFYSYLVDCTYKGSIFDDCVWPRLNPAISNLKTSKEEKKMHKKTKINGHVVHKLPRCENLYYTVEPENGLIRVHMLKYDEGTGEPHYYYYGYMNICAKQLGRHGYLQTQVTYLVLKYSDITPVRNYLEKEKLTRGDLKALNDTIFEEEKKMTEYYVIDVEMTHADYKTKATECLQVRQAGNYFEIPFDGPDCSEYRLNRLADCLYDYAFATLKMCKISLEKSEICSNSVLKVTTPYGDCSDAANREVLCKMLTYAVEHKEYPYPIGNAGLTKICFYLRECNNQKIYETVYSEGIDCTITIEGKVFRDGFYFDYIPEPRDIIKLRFMDGRLTHFTLADDPKRELIASPENTPGALYHIYKRDKPYQYVKELRASLHEIYSKRVMWQNASYVTFTPHGLTD